MNSARSLQQGQSKVRLLVLLGILAALAAYWFLRPTPPLRIPRGPGSPQVQTNSPLLEVEPARMREAMQEAYRLRPDRRCLGALSLVVGWLEPGTSPAVSATFVDGVWRLRAGDQDLGRLPEFPDFDDCQAVMVDWVARRARNERSAGEESPLTWPDLDAASLLSSLRSLPPEGFPTTTEPAALARISRVLVLLSVLSLDSVEITDPLLARAWAVHAFASARSPHDLRADRALLAARMGYSEAAARAAESLAERDPVRLFVEQRTKALLAEADARKSSPLARTLALLRVADQGDYQAWLASLREHWVKRPFAFVVLKSAVDIRKFATNRDYVEVVPYLICMQVASERLVAPPDLSRLLDLFAGDRDAAAVVFASVSRLLNLEAGRLVPRFEHDLEVASQRLPAPALDLSSYRAFYEGYFYSALYALAVFRLDQYSSMPAARKFLESFQGAASPAGSGFARWYENLIDAAKGKPRLPRLMADIFATHPFGEPLRERTFEALEPHLEWGDPMRFDAFRRLIQKLDSRPNHLRLVAGNAYSFLEDVNSAAPLYDQVLRLAGRSSAQIRSWLTTFNSDWDGARRLLDDPKVSIDFKRSLIKRLTKDSSASGLPIDEYLAKLLSRAPENYSLTLVVADRFAKEGRLKEARKVLVDWLALRLPDPGLQRVFVTTRLARVQLLEGKPEQALETIKPASRSEQGGAMAWKAWILDALGRTEEAEAIFENRALRYPNYPLSSIDLAEFYWRHGRFADAAGTLAGMPGGINSNRMILDVRPAFDRVFQSRSDEEVLKAFRALLEAGIGHEALQFLVYPIHHRDRRYELAFRMYEGLRRPEVQQVYVWLSAFEALEKWKGRDEALRWLRERISQPLLNPSSIPLYEMGRADLLWDLGDPDPGDHPEWAWLMRAAATVRWGAMTPERRSILEQYFSVPREDDVHILGRYLIGAGGEEEVWTRARDGRTRAEGAFVMAIRSLCDERYGDAAQWYRVVAEIGTTRLGEYRLARTELRHWYEEGKSLDVQRPRCGPKEERIPDPPEPR